MGIQIHSWKEYKTAVALIQAGAIGKVKEVHTWSEKKWGDTAKTPHHARRHTRRVRLGFLAGRRSRPTIHQRCVSPRQLAQAARFRHRDVRRYGLPHSRPRVRRTATGLARLRPQRERRAQRRKLGHRYSHPLRFSGHAVHRRKNDAAHLVRWRPHSSGRDSRAAGLGEIPRPGVAVYRNKRADAAAAHRHAGAAAVRRISTATRCRRSNAPTIISNSPRPFWATEKRQRRSITPAL